MHTCSPSLGICPHFAHQDHGEHTACGKWRQNPPHPPGVGLGRTGAPPTRQSQPSVAVQGAVLLGGLGGSSGQHPDQEAPLLHAEDHTMDARLRPPITNPTDFSPSLSQRQTPPVPGGFDDHGLMESHRKAHKKRHRLKTGSLWNCNKIPATHNVVQMQDQRAHGQQKNGPKDSHGPVPRSDDMSPVTADGILQEGLSRGP